VTVIVDQFQRIPYEPARDGRVEMHSGLSRHYPTLHANLVAPREHDRSIGIVMAHPASDFLSHFLLRGFAEAGIPSLGVNTRYTSNEPALIMERAALDVGAAVRWMKDRLGFERVLLLGFSGGGSLAAFYQDQAENRGVTHTPAGDPTGFADADLPPADGLMLIGAHPGRAHVLRHWIDPTPMSESEPLELDPRLDLYAPVRATPLDRAWVLEYRQAQLDRMRRIDAMAFERLAELERTGDSDRGFVVHRTVADPRFVDVTLDPSDRAPGSMYGDPARANTAAGGLARFVTVRSWLSTWSIDHTNADALRNLPGVTCPTLVMPLLGDQAAFASESRAMHAALTNAPATLVEVPKLNHYLVDQPHGVSHVTGEVRTWLTGHALAA
jgi:pimeloyl-ACP methyl ester carboxylesterase